MSDMRHSAAGSIGVTLIAVLLLALQAASVREEEQDQQTLEQTSATAPEAPQQHKEGGLNTVRLPPPPRPQSVDALEGSSTVVTTQPPAMHQALKPVIEAAAAPPTLSRTFAPLRLQSEPEPNLKDPSATLKPIQPVPTKYSKSTPIKPLRPEGAIQGPAHREMAESVSNAVKPRRSDEPQGDAFSTDEMPSAERGTVTLDGEGVRQGRALLRILEHGEGPSVEIAWPASDKAREHLFQRFASCYGMRIALMDDGGRLFVGEGRRLAPWSINLDRYSGYVRQASGVTGRAERQAIGRIRAHHGKVVGATPVRLFPRRVDAVLLGGLHELLGGDYASSKTIRATYLLKGGTVIVDAVIVDGRRVPGRIDLSLGTGRTCSA